MPIRDWGATQESKFTPAGSDPGAPGAPTAATAGPVSTAPSVQQQINADPGYQALQQSLQAQGVQDAASRAAAIQRALIMFGIVPEFGGLSRDQQGFLGTDVDQRTRDLAAKNTSEGTSIWARLQKANTDAVRQMRNQLAARGMLGSGETGWGMGEQALRFKQGRFDAENALLETLSGIIGQYTSAERARQLALVQAMQQAAANIPPDPNYQSPSWGQQKSDYISGLGLPYPNYTPPPPPQSRPEDDDPYAYRDGRRPGSV